MIFVSKLQIKALETIGRIVNKSKEVIINNVYDNKRAKGEVAWSVEKELRKNGFSLDASITDKGRISKKEYKVVDLKTRENSFVYLILESKMIKDNSYIETQGYNKGCKKVSKDYKVKLNYSYIQLS